MKTSWPRRIAMWLGATTGFIIVAATIAILITQRVSDGPIEFLQGGSFKTGEMVEGPIEDWSFGLGKHTEFELVGFGTSRTAGYVIHDGIAYMTCDLGFMWNRLEGFQRHILHLIYIFKDWHEHAMIDGRALIRIEGKLYRTRFVRVEDPAIEAALKSHLESLAAEFFQMELGPPPAQPPNDIWFFRMESGW